MRLAIWQPVLLCLAISLPAAAVEKEWTVEELNKKFEDVDRKLDALRDLERNSRTAERRLTDLEDTVRKLRTKVDLLEFHMKNLDENIKALRKDLAALTGRADLAEARTPKQPPEGSGTPSAAIVATIRGQYMSVEGNAVIVQGSIANVTERPLSLVRVEATFLDDRGKVVKTEQGWTEPKMVPAKGTAVFKITTPRDPQIKDYRLTVRAE